MSKILSCLILVLAVWVCRAQTLAPDSMPSAATNAITANATAIANEISRATAAEALRVTNAQLGSYAPTANPIFTGTVLMPRFTGNTTVPPTVAAGPGAGTGTGLAVAIAGSDLAGNITVTTGATALSTLAGGTVVTVTFGTAASGPPNYVSLTPASSSSSLLSGSTNVYVPVPTTGTGFTVVAGTAALNTGVTLKFYYHVIW